MVGEFDRLAIVLPNLRGGGAERVNLDLAKEFRRQGQGVELVLMRAEGELLAEAQAEFPVTELRVDHVRRVPIPLAWYLHRRRPTAVLAAMWPLTVVAPLAQILSGHRCSVVVSEHNTLAAQYRDWGRYHRLLLRVSLAIGHRAAAARVAVSRGVLEDISGLSWMEPESGHVIHNPVPFPHMPSSEALAEADALWRRPHGARILSVGTFKPQKNHDLLLRAFAQLHLPEARLILVGSGGGESGLRALARDLAVEGQVTFAGFQHDPTPFYMTADLFVLSSDHEGFGNVIVEALAQGTPVVSTNCPYGPAEILENGRWGLLVPVGNVTALAAAMEAALSAEHDRAALKRRAADFASSIAAEKYLKLLLPDSKRTTSARTGGS